MSEPCLKCGQPGPHYAPPSLGEEGFYICDRVSSARAAGAPAGAVTMGSPVVPQPAPAAYRHTFAPKQTIAAWMPACSCGWESKTGRLWYDGAEEDWRRHAVAAYQQEDAAEQMRQREELDALMSINTSFTYDDDEADCDDLAGDDVAGSEVRE